MTEFKVGYKVKVIDQYMTSFYNKIGMIVSVNPFSIAPYDVDIDGKMAYCMECELEKVEEDVTKFKVGDKVRFTSGYAKSIGNLVGLEGVVNGYASSNNLGVLLSTGHIMPAAEEELEKVEEEMTQEYEVGKPYLWFGGECPLPPGTKVEVRFGKSDFSVISRYWRPYRVMRAEGPYWGHNFDSTSANIVMFKVLEYPKQTRKVELELTEEEIEKIKSVLGKANL